MFRALHSICRLNTCVNRVGRDVCLKRNFVSFAHTSYAIFYLLIVVFFLYYFITNSKQLIGFKGILNRFLTLAKKWLLFKNYDAVLYIQFILGKVCKPVTQ